MAKSGTVEPTSSGSTTTTSPGIMSGSGTLFDPALKQRLVDAMGRAYDE